MRTALLFPLLLAACSSTPEDDSRDGADATACEETDGVRIHFFLTEGEPSKGPLRWNKSAGSLVEITRSPDLRHASVLWSDGHDGLTCTFPRGQKCRFQWDDPVLEDRFLYVFHQGDHAMVTAELPRGCPIRPRLLFTIDLEPGAFPAEFQWSGRAPRKLTRARNLILVELPRGKGNVLKAGEWKVELRTPKGNENFLVGVDPDGTPTATSGHVRALR